MSIFCVCFCLVYPFIPLESYVCFCYTHCKWLCWVGMRTMSQGFFAPLPFACSNMPSKIFYSSISAEILRIGRTSSSSSDFINRSGLLLDRMMKQGSIKSRVSKALTNMYNRHSTDLFHISNNIKGFVQLIL